MSSNNGQSGRGSIDSEGCNSRFNSASRLLLVHLPPMGKRSGADTQPSRTCNAFGSLA